MTLVKKLYRLALAIKVIDNGPGIPRDIQERMFYPLVSGREGGWTRAHHRAEFRPAPSGDDRMQ